MFYVPMSDFVKTKIILFNYFSAVIVTETYTSKGDFFYFEEGRNIYVQGS